MIYKQFIKMFHQKQLKRLNIYKKKAHDYATEDILSNFKRIGAILKVWNLKKLSPDIIVCFLLIILKIDRWLNLLINNKRPKNESIEDTVLDLHNYIDLTDALIKEQSYDKKKIQK